MQIKIDFMKKYLYLIIGLVIALAGAVFVFAYADTNGVGHDASSVGPGAFASGAYIVPNNDDSYLSIPWIKVPAWHNLKVGDPDPMRIWYGNRDVNEAQNWLTLSFGGADAVWFGDDGSGYFNTSVGVGRTFDIYPWPGYDYGGDTASIWYGNIGAGSTENWLTFRFGGADKAYISETGNGYFVGNITAVQNMYAVAYEYLSDESLKKNIKPIDGALDKIKELDGVSFEWKEGGKAGIGLIAQDVEQVFPELVSTNSKTGLKSVGYGNLVAVLIEAVKEQQREIDELKEDIEKLKKE